MPLNPDRVRIAVVDDDPMILGVFSSLMRQFGYHADFFPDAEKAFKELSAHLERYDLVIADIFMPGEDGVSFAKRVRALLPDLPIMFMTGGNPTEEKRTEALSLGRVVFLEKPFPLVQTLNEMIKEFLSKP